MFVGFQKHTKSVKAFSIYAAVQFHCVLLKWKTGMRRAKEYEFNFEMK